MNIWSDIWRLFFPKSCLICGSSLTKSEEHICFRCMAGLPRAHIHLRQVNEMEKSLWGKFPVERAEAYLYYIKGGDAQRILFELKYYGNLKLAYFLGRCMALELRSSDFFDGIDYIVPVPLHRKKLKKRGYNQSEVLAEGVAYVTGIPMATDLLVREQYTETQTHKGNYERWMNVKGIFGCNSWENFKGKHLLLVDDVFTTGATVVACADALACIPDLKLSVLTLAIAGES